MGKLTGKHLCYVIFSEMSPSSFIDMLELNFGIVGLIHIRENGNEELYEEAKQKMLNLFTGTISFDFKFSMNPFYFNKRINGKLDGCYKICIFEQDFEKKDYVCQTSSLYYNGVPKFFDEDGKIIKNSLN